MILQWHAVAWEEYVAWQVLDKNMLKKINALIADTLRYPTEGIGKPEPLKYELEGAWSRRINAEHRLVYMFDENVVTIAGCRGHYS